MKPLRHLIPRIASGFAAVFGALAACAAPEDELSVSQWAEAHREVGAESQSPIPGKWSNARGPYLCEPMDACQLENGIARVVIAGCAQFGKTEISLNALMWAIEYAPRGVMVLLPAIDEGRRWSALKWEPNVEASERIRAKVYQRKSRSADGSTTMIKRFRGGSVEIATAGSSKGLQMRTYGLLLADEVDQFEAQVGVGGDPISGAERGMLPYGDEAKTIVSGTYGFAGESRMESEFDASDQRRFYTPCPHCGGAHVLEFSTFSLHEGRPVFSCIGCGCLIEEGHKRGMNAGGFWLPTFEHPEQDEEGQPNSARARNPAPPKFIAAEDLDTFAPFDPERGYRVALRDCEGRPRGYHLWQAQSNLSSWQVIWKKWQDVQAGVGGEPNAIEFAQKILGVPYERKVDRPDHEKLYEARGQLYRDEGIVPEWASIVVGFIDVQHNRLEWGVYAFGRGGVGARIAKGVIPKNPLDWSTWSVDAYALVNTTFHGPMYKARLADYWGVDSGGNATENVYNFCMPLQHRAQPVLVLKGSSHDKGDAPAFAPGNRVKVRRKGVTIGTVQLWFTGTHGLKSRVYHGLAAGVVSTESRRLEARALVYGRQATKDDFKQLTAEYLSKKDPRERGRWEKPQGVANEQLDIAVGCLALAINEGLDRLDELQWAQRMSARAPDLVEAQLTPLERLMMAPADDGEHVEAEAPPALEPPPAEGRRQSLTDTDLAAIRDLAKQWGGA